MAKGATCEYRKLNNRVETCDEDDCWTEVSNDYFNLQGFPPIKQTTFNGKKFCGKKMIRNGEIVNYFTSQYKNDKKMECHPERKR